MMSEASSPTCNCPAENPFASLAAWGWIFVGSLVTFGVVVLVREVRHCFRLGHLHAKHAVYLRQLYFLALARGSS